MAINFSKIREFEQGQKAEQQKRTEGQLIDLIQVMSLHRIGFNLAVLRESAPEVFVDFKNLSKNPADEIKATCGFFTARLFKLLGDRKSAVETVWNAIRPLRLNQSSQEALEVAAAVSFEVLRHVGERETNSAPEPISNFPKPEEKSVEVIEPKPTAPAYEDKGFEQSLGETSDTLKKLAAEKQKRSEASKKAAATRKAAKR